MIAAIAWDDVNVKMGHRLAGSRTIIDADVVAVGRMVLLDCLLCSVEKFQ